MARSVTTAQMLTRVRRRADIESKLDRFPDAGLIDDLNEGIADLWDELVKARGHGYYQSDITITTVAGVSQYALDATFLSVENVAAKIQGRNITFTPFELAERAELTNVGSGGWTGAPFMYRLRAGFVELLPTPTGVYTVTMTIVPAAKLLAGNQDTFDGINGWEEMPICWAARKAAIKNGAWTLVGVLKEDIESVRERVRALAPKRAAGPGKIIDVRLIERQQRSRRFRAF